MSTLDPRSPAGAPQPGIPQPGELLAGKYRIGALLGRGGMGIVVSAEHERLRQAVAIKFLQPTHARDEESLRRFLREARAAASLTSVHATRIFDVDATEDGVPYIVMERLTGTTLDNVLDERGPLAIGEAVRFVLEACEALGEAHAAGLVHRDLKPSNLFVARARDGALSIKVLDFGISKSVVEGDLGETSITAPNTLLGSPQYMSPEQVKNARNVDARTDLWSMGIILHQLLTLEPPFEADSIPHLYALILSAAPTPLRAVLPKAPARLEQIILQCLEKDPAKRPRDVGELARALAPFAADKSAPAKGRGGATGDVPPSREKKPSTVAEPFAETQPAQPQGRRFERTREVAMGAVAIAIAAVTVVLLVRHAGAPEGARGPAAVSASAAPSAAASAPRAEPPDDAPPVAAMPVMQAPMERVSEAVDAGAPRPNAPRSSAPPATSAPRVRDLKGIKLLP